MTNVLPVTDDIAQLTFDLGRCLRQKMLQCSDSGMHIPQMHALLFIQSHPGITMKELATMMRVTSPSATSFVDRLVKLGHVRRASDATNRKLVRLHLTEDGAESLKHTMADRRKMLLHILSVLSPADQESLKSIMQKLITHCSR
jgi:DNA-binding MarR family transcriptional regulator